MLLHPSSRLLESWKINGLKLYWQHVLAQYLTKSLYVDFAFNLFPLCMHQFKTFLSSLLPAECKVITDN